MNTAKISERVASSFLVGTFTLYGDEYPNDSLYAKQMAKVLTTPLSSMVDKKTWNAVRDWAERARPSVHEMGSLLLAIDSGDANQVIGGRIKNVSDVKKITKRLGI